MTNERLPDVIVRVIEDIYKRFSEPITIDDMARLAKYSRFHFTRMFQQATGVAPGQFLTAVRIQEAKRLLLSTSLSVKEITTRVGYSSAGTFSAKFKSSVGFSPAAYRAAYVSGGNAFGWPTGEHSSQVPLTPGFQAAELALDEQQAVPGSPVGRPVHGQHAADEDRVVSAVVGAPPLAFEPGQRADD
jgi:AraC-like DNA-binding protein